MKYFGLVITSSLVFCASLFANEEVAEHVAHHTPSIADLTAPYVNFIVLFSFIKLLTILDGFL